MSLNVLLRSMLRASYWLLDHSAGCEPREQRPSIKFQFLRHPLSEAGQLSESVDAVGAHRFTNACRSRRVPSGRPYWRGTNNARSECLPCSPAGRPPPRERRTLGSHERRRTTATRHGITFRGSLRWRARACAGPTYRRCGNTSRATKLFLPVARGVLSC